MTWREIHADANLRMASMMLDQQGRLNGLNEKIRKIRAILARENDGPFSSREILDEIEGVLNDAD